MLTQTSNNRINRTIITLSLIFMTLLSLPGHTEARPVEPPPVKPTMAQIAKMMRQQPLMFVEEEPQRYHLRGSGRSMWFTPEAIWLQVQTNEPDDSSRQPRAGNLSLDESRAPFSSLVNRESQIVNLKLTFPEANPEVTIEPLARQETHVSYFIGNDPDKWRSDVAVYEGVRYRELYPGLDLVVSGVNGQMTWEWEGAPDQTLKVSETFRVSVDDGTTQQTYTAAELQDNNNGLGNGTDGLANLVSQSVNFINPVLSPPQAPLADDPSQLVWSTFLGGSGDDSQFYADIALDSTGNVYLTGSTKSSNFPITTGSHDTNLNGSSDAFVVKLNSSGTTLGYATFLGGWSYDEGYAIAIDSSNNAYLTGSTSSSDFPTTVGAYDTTINGYDAFVVKLNSSGTTLSYATFLGGSGGMGDYGNAITVDSNGNAYLTGRTSSSDFPTTVGAYDTTVNGYDAFVVKLNSSGTALSYATFLGGSGGIGGDEGYAIAVDSSGNAYLTGFTWSTDFPTTAGAYDTTLGGAVDAFVVKLNSSGTTLIYATFLGGSSSWDHGYAITVDSSGNAYLTGETRSSDFPTTIGSYDTTFNGGNWDAFIVKLNSSGTALNYATFLGGSEDDSGRAIAIDSSHNVYLTGATKSSDFPTTVGVYDTTFNGGTWDAFVVKLNSSGTVLNYATFLGGNSNDEGLAITVDSSNAYLVGHTQSNDFPTTIGVYDTTFNGGNWDAFVTKLSTIISPNPDLTLSALSLNSSTICEGSSVTVYATASNQGASNASGHYIYYYNDSSNSGYSSQVGSDYISSLSSGSSSNQNHTFTASTAGTRYIKAYIDATSAVDETSETNNGDYVTLTVNSDNTNPTGSISINGGASTTSSQNVTLSLSATDVGGTCNSGLYQMRFSNDGISWSSWETYSTNKSWTLSSGDGTKTVYVQFKDNAGNTSSSYSDTITLSSPQPDLTISSLSLSSSSICLGSSVTVYATERNQGSSSAGTHYLYYYNDSSNSGYSSYIGNDYISSLPASSNSYQNLTFTPSAAGTRYIKARADGSSAISESDETNNGDYVTLTVNSDSTAPTGSISINSGASSTTSTSVSLSLSATDSGTCASGLYQMRFSNDGVSWSSWENYSSSKSWSLASGDGSKTVYVQFRDTQGNISSSYTDSINLDTVAPASSVTSPSGTSSSSSFTVYWSGSDGTSGIKDYDIQYQQDGGAWTTWQSNTSLTSATFSGAVDGSSYCFRSRAEDNAGWQESYPAGNDVCVTINLPKPDLYVQSLSLSNNSICLGDGVTVYATERNQGGSSASGHYLYYYDDSSASGYSSYVGNDYLSNLNVSSSSSQNLTFTPSSAGTRYIKSYADATGTNSESNESNNGSSIILTVNSDTNAPSGSININSGATYATNQTVSLALTALDSGTCATGVSQMRFSNDGSSWSSWESYAVSKSWSLSSGDGNKTVYVQFKDTQGNSSSSYNDSISLDGTAPTSSVTAPSGGTSNSSFTVAWSGSDSGSGLKNYDIQRQIDGGSWSDWQINSSSSSALFSGAVSGSSYCFRSRAEDNAGNLEAYPVTADTCVTVTPSAPTLNAINNADGDGNYSISWSSSNGATSYTLEEDDNASFTSPTTLYNGSSTSHNVTGQSAGIWYYRVKASNTGGDSSWSNTESVSLIPGAPILDAILNSDGDGAYDLSWSSIAGSTSYTVQEDDNNSFTSPITVCSGNITSCSLTGRTSGSWYYRVRATSAGGDGPWGNIQSSAVKPSAPTLNAIANSDQDGDYSISWSSQPGTTSYILQQADTVDFSTPITSYNGSSTSYNVVGQTTGVWYYRVKASNAGGDSSWSNIESASVKPAAPSLDPIANSDGDGSYTISWSTVSGALTYTLQIAADNGFSSVTTAYQGGLNNTSISNQSPGLWYYRVKTSNAAGDSDWSNVQTVTVDMPPDAVVLTGVTGGLVNSSYNFTATTSPITATEPLNYLWQAEEQSQVNRTNQGLNDSLSFSWSGTGLKHITVTVSNGVGAVSSSHTINIQPILSPPTATIELISPNPAYVDQTISFQGRGDDPDGGAIADYEWRTASGIIGNVASFNLSGSTIGTGTHTVYFKVKDNEGDWSDDITQTLTISNSPLTLSIDQLTFKNQTLGTPSVSQTVIVYNSGDVPVNITSIVSSGDFTQTNNCPATLALNSQCTINVTFIPTANGARNGSLTITSDAFGSPHMVNLSGTGAVPNTPAVTLNPTSLNFGNQVINTTSATQTVTLENTGSAALTISDISVTGAYSLSHTCPASLASSATCTLTVRFSPIITGTQASTVTVVSDAATSPDTASLTGIGTAPAVALAASQLDFGNQILNTPTATQTISLTNSGTAPLALTDISVSGEYALSHDCPATLAAGATCRLNLSFTPLQTGSRPGSVTLQHDAAGSPHTITLTGTGLDPAAPGIQLTPTQLDFGSQEANTVSAVRTVTLQNPGNASLTISDIVISGDFSQTHTCPASLSAMASCTISLTFRPTMTGTRVGLLTINSNAPTSPDAVSLSGSGTAPQPPLTPSDPALNFNDTRLTQTLTITNNGSNPVTIGTITTDPPFNQTNNCPPVLAVGASCQITVGFNPTGPGVSNGNVTIDTDAPTGPTIIDLTGQSGGTTSPVGLSTTDLQLTAPHVGSVSPPQVVTLTNTGQTPFTVDTINTTGDFNHNHNCGPTLAVGATCQISVTFSPSSPTASSGTLTIGANGESHPVALTGNVTNPSACPFPLTGVGVTVLGPQKGVVGAKDSFSAVPNPSNATPPLTFIWSPQPTSGQGTIQATYQWRQAGPQIVSVTVSNCGGVSNDELTVTVAEPPPATTGDSFEEDDQCSQASTIVVNGASQDHTFHDSGDEDWVQFPAVAGQTYIIAARVPPQAQTDVVLETRQQCSADPSNFQDAFSGDVRQIFIATQDGPIYLRLRNSQAALFGADHEYTLSVENPQQSAATGAMIIVAGRHEDQDKLQDNIHHVTRKVYQMALDNGCAAENIYVLATDPTLPGFSTFARTDTLQQAITEWAVPKVGADQPLTLFMMDHGGDNTFYLDGRNQIVSPSQLDTWLTQVELQTNAPTNVIIEACNSGSFIDPVPSISKPNRVVIASTGASRLAYASDKGAIFADALLEQIIGGANLHHAFIEARWTAEQNDINQTPWLDDNGNAQPNETTVEGQVAAQRIFACTPPQPKANMQPDVAELLVRRLDPATGQGEIWAKVLDDQQVASVWAIIYPPSHTQSRQANDTLTSPVLRTMLQPQANDWYGVNYTQFTETGDYRIVLYAEDDTGLQSRPRELVLSTVVHSVGQVYLPMLMK